MSKITSSVKSKNSLPQLLKKISSLSNWEGVAGYDETPHPSGENTYAEIAYANNEGIGNNPERKFMDLAVALSEHQASRVGSTIVSNVLYKKIPAKDEIKEFAQMLAGDITSAIDEGFWEVTSNDTPLVDTGALRANPKFWVEKK